MNEGTQTIIHISRLETRDLKVAAEDASGIGEGKEFHKGTTDTKKEDL